MTKYKKAGFVYCSYNKAMPCCIKIGRSKDDEYRNKKGLYYGHSGVPLPFDVLDRIYVEDVEGVEKSIHKIFTKFRINEQREFFGYTNDILLDEPSDILLKIKKLKNELIPEIKYLFEILRKQYDQPEEDISNDEDEQISSDNISDNISDISDQKMPSNTLSIKAHRSSKEYTIEQTKLKKIDFVSKGISHYNGNKKLFIKNIVDDTLPKELSNISTRKNCNNTLESVQTFIRRIQKLIRNNIK